MTENLHQEEQKTLPLVTVSQDNIANVNVTVEETELEPYKKHFIKEKQKNVVLRGFRKGTAPEEMVAKFFRDEARSSARDNVIYVKYMKLLQEHKLQPLSEPKLDNVHEEDGKIYANLHVDVLQPVVLGQYLGLEVQKMPPVSAVDNVSKTLHEIRQRYPKLTELTDATVTTNQVVTIDFTMSHDGKQLEEQKDLKVTLGLNLFFKDFEDQLLGTNVGQTKEFDLQFPNTYPKEELKDKLVHFSLSIKSIHSISEYTDEELSKVLGYETVDKMLEAITNEITTKHTDDEHLYYENQILGQLLSAHQFAIPRKLIDTEIKKLLSERPDMASQQAEDVADRFVRTDLILHAIYERHPDIQFKEEEFNAKVTELATRANDTVEGITKKLQASGKLQSYVNYLKNCKVIDFLIDTSDKKELVIIKEENNVVINTEEKENG